MLIEFNRVSKTFPNGTIALDDVSFGIERGEFVFIIGQSGAGKSTLIKLLTCEEKITKGHVQIDKYRLHKMKKRHIPMLRREIGMIFQDFRLIETKTVFENVAFAMEIIGESRKNINRQVPLMLSIVGLRDKMNVYPSELSGGEQQRVGLARAIVNGPKLILADEPTGNLDPTNSEAIMALLEEINRNGTTVVICTHDKEFVNKMQKRVLEIKDGMLKRDEYQSGYSVAWESPHNLESEDLKKQKKAKIKKQSKKEYQVELDQQEKDLAEDVAVIEESEMASPLDPVAKDEVGNNPDVAIEATELPDVEKRIISDHQLRSEKKDFTKRMERLHEKIGASMSESQEKVEPNSDQEEQQVAEKSAQTNDPEGKQEEEEKKL